MKFLKPTAEHRRTFSNIQMIKNINESSSKGHTNKQRLIQKNTSPSFLTTMRDSKTAQYNTLHLSTSPSSSRSSTPLSSVAVNSQKRKSEETGNTTSKSKKSCTERPNRFEEFIMEQVAQPESEVATFYNFVKTRLEKLDRQYYLKATHNIMYQLIKLEITADDEPSGK